MCDTKRVPRRRIGYMCASLSVTCDHTRREVCVGWTQAEAEVEEVEREPERYTTEYTVW